MLRTDSAKQRRRVMQAHEVDAAVTKAKNHATQSLSV
jgi:hypothetical protein